MSTPALPLVSALGWADSQGASINLHPIIATIQGPTLPADILHALIISRLLLNGHIVCTVGLAYSYQHIAALCKKIGSVTLDSYISSGHLLYIDLLQQYSTSLLNPSSSSINDPLFTFQGLFEKIQTAYHLIQQFHQQFIQFSICFDDFSYFVDILNQQNIQPGDSIDFLSALLQFTHPPLYAQLTTPPSPLLTNSSIPTPDTSKLLPGTLSLILSAPLCSVQTNPQSPSTLFKPFPTNSVIIPHSTTSHLADLSTASTRSSFDLPILTGDITAIIIRFLSSLAFSSALHSPEQKEISSNLKPNVHTSPLFLELTHLSSGYSKDIYCQLTLLTPPTQFCAISSTPQPLKTQLHILYLVVDNTGALTCHSRA